MKKFLLSLVALLSGVGAWAGVTDFPEITTDVNNPIYYTIYNTRSAEPGGLMYYAGDAVGLKDGCTAATLEDKYKFYFTGSHDALYIHNAATTKKLASVESWTDGGSVWAFASRTAADGVAVGPQGGSGNVFWNDKNYSTDATTSDFTVWSKDDAGSGFVFERADSWVFPKTGNIYSIEAPLFEKVQGVKKGLYVKDDGSLAWGTFDHMNRNCLWKATVNADGTVVFKNLGTGTYIGDLDTSETTVNTTLQSLGSNQFNIKVTVPNAEDTGTETHTFHANSHGNGTSTSGNIVSWPGLIGSASAWSFVEQVDPDAVTHVTVTYNFMYNGVSKGTQTVELLDGDEYPDLELLWWGVQATKPEGTVSATEAVEGIVTKDIVVTANTPFEFADTYADIANWYYLKLNLNSYLYHVAGQDYIDASKTSPNYDNIDAFIWAFVGNPFDGFQIVNKLAGETMVLTSPDPAGTTGNGADIHPVMGTTSNAWTFSTSTHGTNGFYIAYGTTDKRMNKRDGKLAYWTAGADAGSTFVVASVDATGMTDLTPVLEKAKAWQSNIGIGTAVGNVTAESASGLDAAIRNADAAVESGTGLFACINPLNNALANLVTVQPNPAKYYRIVSSCTVDHRAGQLVYVNNTGGMKFARESDNLATSLGYIFRFEDAGSGKFYIYNVERGVYMQSVGAASKTDVANAKAVTISNMGKDNIVSIKPDGQNMMHAQDAGSSIVGWNNSEYTSASAWKIEEIDITTASHPVTISDAGYATLCLGYNATIPENIKAFYVSGTDAEKANMEELDGVIPANCAVVLKGAAGTYEFKADATSPTAPENKLQGSTINTYVEGEGYVLSKQNNVVALYKATLDKNASGAEGTENSNTHFLNNAFKAYLPVESASAARFYIFDFGTETGINNIESGETINGNAVTYDLSGRRVQNAQKGIYIVNGKKVIK